MKRRIVLFVEGLGDDKAAQKLVGGLLTEQKAWDCIILDPNPLRVGDFPALAKNGFHQWKRFLRLALKRRDVGGILLLLDGDSRVASGKFCVVEAARELAKESMTVNGGTAFSVAIVFARQEFESWLIAGWKSLGGQTLPDGRMLKPDALLPNTDLEESPRDAKGWLHSAIDGGYRPTRDQFELTRLVNLNSIRERNLRSFRRLECAIDKLVQAIRGNQHAVSPL